MISNPKVIGGVTYENVILSPEQFIVISSQSISEDKAEKLIFN